MNKIEPEKFKNCEKCDFLNYDHSNGFSCPTGVEISFKEKPSDCPFREC